MDIDTIKKITNQGIAIAIVVALGIGVAHYYVQHWLPNKISMDKADVDLKVKLGDSIEKMADSAEKTASIMSSMDGRLTEQGEEIKGISNTVEIIMTHITLPSE